MIDFGDKELVKKYGTWMKVQVAFYDHLFAAATEGMPAREFNQLRWREGNVIYEKAIAKVVRRFKTADEAFAMFREHALYHDHSKDHDA
jgi:hypothetical protein